MTRDEICQELVDLGLTTRGQLHDITDSLPEESRTSSEALLKEMVRLGKITRFQANAIYGGKGEALKLGSYVVEEKLGRGGFGTVYRAKHQLMDRTVAIKVVNRDLVEDRSAIERFLKEVRTAAKLEHRNIVKAFDANQSDGSFFLVMEYVDGQLLSDLLRLQGTLTVESAVDYMIQTAMGLDYAHHQGIVHRDIKPSNLIIDSEGRVRILDMGLARLEEPDDADRSESGRKIAAGTRDFMSPEQALGTLAVDRRSDIYSLGCTLYALLTGRVMYPGPSEAKKAVDHQITPPPKLSALRPDVPPNLEAVYRKMVTKHPKDRYQTMQEVITALEPFASASIHEDAIPTRWDSGIRQYVDGSGRPISNEKLNSAEVATINPNDTQIEGLGVSYDVIAFPSISPFDEQGSHVSKRRRWNLIAGGLVSFVVVCGLLSGTQWAKTGLGVQSQEPKPKSNRVPFFARHDLESRDQVVARGGGFFQSRTSSTPSEKGLSDATDEPISALDAIDVNEPELEPQEPRRNDEIPANAPESVQVAPPSSEIDSVLWYANFGDVKNSVTAYVGETNIERRGETVFFTQSFHNRLERETPFAVSIHEDMTSVGVGDIPGVLRFRFDHGPELAKYIGFKLGAKIPGRYIHLPTWAARQVGVSNLEETFLEFYICAVRPAEFEHAAIPCDIRLEQNHRSHYASRLGLGNLQLTKDWQLVRVRLSEGDNRDVFIESMQENPDASIVMIWAFDGDKVIAGDAIEVDSVRFLHQPMKAP